MTFTDDDLKRLSNEMDHTDQFPKLKALIARMEAAERFIDHSGMMIDAEDHPYYRAWRKAAGK